MKLFPSYRRHRASYVCLLLWSPNAELERVHAFVSSRTLCFALRHVFKMS